VRVRVESKCARKGACRLRTHLNSTRTLTLNLSHGVPRERGPDRRRDPRACNAMQPDATPCNAMQRHATDSAVVQNEPTAVDQADSHPARPRVPVATDPVTRNIALRASGRPRATPCNRVQRHATPCNRFRGSEKRTQTREIARARAHVPVNHHPTTNRFRPNPLPAVTHTRPTVTNRSDGVL
jgi:hypothetical protein